MKSEKATMYKGWRNMAHKAQKQRNGEDRVLNELSGGQVTGDWQHHKKDTDLSRLLDIFNSCLEKKLMGKSQVKLASNKESIS